MRKILNCLFIGITLFLIFTSSVSAVEKNRVNLYLFYSNDCPHCADEKKLLKELQEDYDNLYIYQYEVIESNKVFNDVQKLLDVKITGTPFTVIGEMHYTGFSKTATKRQFINVIEFYSEHGYEDKVGKLLNMELPTYEVKENDDIYKYLEKLDNRFLNIPLIGEVNLKNIALPFVTVIMGLLDGFNPCSMWILLFLISILMGMNNKKRMLRLGLSFLFASALTYLLFMIAWLNVTSLLSTTVYLKMGIALIALIGGCINLSSYFKTRKETGCEVVNDSKRKKIFTKIKNFTREKNFVIALLGIVSLAISVNIIELACSAGLPVMFIEILNINDLTSFEYYLYIILYVILFMLDDMVVFIIAVITMELTGFSTKYGKLSKLLGGSLLIIIGILMLFKPGWLMFNFN